MGAGCEILERLVHCFMRSGGKNSEQTHLEVERKFRLSANEFETLPDRLLERGFTAGASVIMIDTFLPAVRQGDMLRVRVESGDGLVHNLITAKTWLYLPDGSKERQESELSIGAWIGRFLLGLGRWLHGAALPAFSKERRLFHGALHGLDAVVSLDRLDSLGEFSGYYMEIEIIVPVGSGVEPARQRILNCAAELLGEDREPVSLSYMEMLKRASQAANISIE